MPERIADLLRQLHRRLRNVEETGRGSERKHSEWRERAPHLGGLASGRQMLRERDGPHREGEEP